MIRRAVVPIPVTSGTGSVTAIARNSSGGFFAPYLNGRCIQVGLIPPYGTQPSGTFYCFDEVNFVPISGNFSGAWNWNGKAGLLGNITVNIVNANTGASPTSGLFAAVFIFDDIQK